MKKFEIIPYSGSGGSKGGYKPKIDKDTLFSRDYLEAVVAFGEGVFYGLVDGLNSVSFNGEYLSFRDNIDVKDLYLSLRLGYEDDAPIDYFLGGENFIISSLQKELLYDRAETYRTTPELRGKIRFVQLRFIIQGLFSGNSKGDLLTNQVALQIRYKPSKAPQTSWVYVSESTNSTTHKSLILDSAKAKAREEGKDWSLLSSAEKEKLISEVEKIIVEQDYTSASGSVEVVKSFGITHPSARLTVISKIISKKEAKENSYSDKFKGENLYIISGKTTSGYVHELTLPLPPMDDDDWVIEVVKASEEYPTSEEYSRRTIGISEVSAIMAKYRHYPRTVLAHIVAPYDTQFQAVGDVAAEFYCLLIDVPTNYNGFLHQYDETDIWLGDYKKAWSNNNVWVLREIIMNPDWGMRRYEPNINVDNASFYRWAKYCDEKLVNIEGEKSLGFRHTFNDVINNPRNLESFISYVCSSFRGSLEERNGIYYLNVDTKRKPKFFVTPEVISDVGFTYSKTELGTRWNQVKVSFQNQELDYTEDSRIISDKKSIEKYGLITGEVQPVGCTDLSQAIRHGVYALFTNSKETTICSFQIPRLGLYLEKFDNFYICDPDLNWGYPARLAEIESDTRLTLMHPCALPIGTEVVVMFQLRDEVAEVVALVTGEREIILQRGGDKPYELYEDTPIAYYPIGSKNKPQVFRVLNVSDEGTGDALMYTIEASSVFTDKYDMVDHIDANSQELVFSSESFENIFNRINPPTNVRVQILDYSTKNGAPVYRVLFDEVPEASQYEATWYLSEGDGDQYEQEIYGSRSELSPAFPANGIPINFSLVAVAADGRRSRPVHLLRYTPAVSFGDLDIELNISSCGFVVTNGEYWFVVVFSNLNPLLPWGKSKYLNMRTTMVLDSNPSHTYPSFGFSTIERAKDRNSIIPLGLYSDGSTTPNVALPDITKEQTLSLTVELSLKDNPTVFELVRNKVNLTYGRDKPTPIVTPRRRSVFRKDTYIDTLGVEREVSEGYVALVIWLNLPDLADNYILNSNHEFYLKISGVTNKDPLYRKQLYFTAVRLNSDMVEVTLNEEVVEDESLTVWHESYYDALIPFKSRDLSIHY